MQLETAGLSQLRSLLKYTTKESLHYTKLKKALRQKQQSADSASSSPIGQAGSVQLRSCCDALVSYKEISHLQIEQDPNQR